MCGEKLPEKAIYCPKCGTKKENSDVSSDNLQGQEIKSETENLAVSSKQVEAPVFIENDKLDEKVCKQCGALNYSFRTDCKVCSSTFFIFPLNVGLKKENIKISPTSAFKEIDWDKIDLAQNIKFDEKKNIFRNIAIFAFVILLVFAIASFVQNRSFSDPFKPLSDLPIQSAPNSPNLSTATDSSALNSPDLSTATDSAEIINALNLLGLGNWNLATVGDSNNATTYISDWPCLLIMANGAAAFTDIWNEKVVYNSYSGAWLAVNSKNWIVNDLSASQSCIQYFSSAYGGQLVNN
jgi:ribosomal protein L40E